MNGKEQHDHLGELLRRAMPDDLPAALEQSMQQRLTAFRERFDAAAPGGPQTQVRLPSRLILWIGGLTMRQRIALGSAAVAVLLGFLMLWLGLDTKPLSAMEKMADNIRKAKSYMYTLTRQQLSVVTPDKPPIAQTRTLNKGYSLADGSWRSESALVVSICPAGKPGISLDPRAKTYRRIAHPHDSLAMNDVQYLGNFVGQADRELGVKEINGKKVRGFEIDPRKTYPQYAAAANPAGIVEEVWIDIESNLPVQTRREGKYSTGGRFIDILDMQWNIDFDPKFFDATPPEGYRDVTPKPPASEQEIRQITDALKVYADASGGQYPQDNRDLVASTTSKSLGGGERPARTTVQGLRQIRELQVYNPDFAYYGKTVGPGDKDKVLVRWKLDDGRYEVIFGDLCSETVTAERLRALEGK